MPTPFDITFASAAVVLFAEFGEEVVYIPRDGAERTITVIVNRMSIEAVSGFDNIVSPKLTVRAFADPATETYGGIDPEDVDSGGDKLRIAWVKDTDPEDRTINKVLKVNGGMVFFEVV